MCKENSQVRVDRISTWVVFRPSLCQGCFAGCCTLPVEVSAADLIRLGLITEDEAAFSLKKVARKLHKSGHIQSFNARSQLFILQQRPNGDCYFLEESTRRCTVYSKRPQVCRSFPKIGPRPGWCPAQRKMRKKNNLEP